MCSKASHTNTTHKTTRFLIPFISKAVLKKYGICCGRNIEAGLSAAPSLLTTSFFFSLDLDVRISPHIERELERGIITALCSSLRVHQWLLSLQTYLNESFMLALCDLVVAVFFDGQICMSVDLRLGRSPQSLLHIALGNECWLRWRLLTCCIQVASRYTMLIVDRLSTHFIC